jgi:thiamine pyrophosphokinase
VGEIVSLVPLDAQVAGVRTDGLRWRLDGDALPLGSTRGISNEPVAERVQVGVARGRLLVVRHFPAR